MQENKTENPSWLQKLKNESWEAELLVSAVAIYAIFKSFAFFNWVCDLFINKLDPSQYFLGYLITLLGFLAFGMLGALFVIHFGLRAYWIGLVGLNSVFPDYSLEDSAYSKIYTKKLLEKLPRIQTSIKNLDEVCSVLFSVAFTLLIIYLYMGLFSSVYLLLFNLLSDKVPTYILLIPLAILALIYSVQMTITIIANFKKFKENDKIQNLYYHASIWGSKIFYGPLYKSLLQVTMIFGSNFKKKKTLIRTILFMLVFGAILGLYQLFQSNVIVLMNFNKSLDQTKMYEYYYKNNNTEKSLLLAPEIENELITAQTTKLFIPIFDYEISKYETLCNLNGLPFENEEQKTKNRLAYLDCYQENHTLSIDTTPVVLKFYKIDHPLTGQFGIQAFLDLTALSNGNHTLKIVKKINKEEKTWVIPFFLSK